MDGQGHGGGSRAEAERWLYTANKVLSARDLHGARSFAIRARESDPRYEPTELLLTVIDTLMAGEARINDHFDWYAILQVLRYTQNIDYITAQYRRLATQLDPHHNPFAFASHAFTLVNDAWSVLSNPTKKAFYDNQLRLLTQPAPPPQPPPPPPPPPLASPAPVAFFPIQPPQPNLNPNQFPQRESPRPRVEVEPPPPPPSQVDNATELTRASDVETEGVSFWTACPYCYVMYEYPKVYEDCTLRCQNCRRGFHGVVVPSPSKDGTFGSFCSWGFFPVGFSGDFKDINGSSSKWNPFSPLFPCALQGGEENGRYQKGPWVFYDDDESAEFVEGGSDTTEDDSDDDDWRGGNQKGTTRKRKRRKKSSNVGGGGDVRRVPTTIERPRRGVQNSDGNDNVENGEAVDGGTGGAIAVVVPESSKKAVALGGSRRRSERNLGKLDLNVEFSNEVEEPMYGPGEGNVNGNAEDNIEGIGFFEGLDEFLSSLPILNVVADDKVKGH
ncbi:hypothetical protein JHK82_037303 [Glycine max]|uniref:J domain-containing protein n=2 Tax=Glycine subgen. Soja TaxID=1462606 RepID=K7M1W8_SOYBN|nr:uncharacterized protein LOC100818960 [Glycine max]XP_028187768.1 uncharacterized protein LOC114374329 [Glycine soja]KAG5114034.1 hypothetical protein JHK82_037303 [Glycine max]KRH21766.1 hypothetical protein GLYMA_13G257100v4 [Glycine max]RZB82883.1 hypothetical protein D0Y65_031800 [Glycine soja]|eukprot:XP_003541786.1 uncharacterized protein LOC100818960 [Glycine max]